MEPGAWGLAAVAPERRFGAPRRRKVCPRQAAAEDLLIENDGPRQLVMALGKGNRAVGGQSVNCRQQFLHRRNADHFSPGRWQGRHLGKPGRDRLSGAEPAATEDRH